MLFFPAIDHISIPASKKHIHDKLQCQKDLLIHRLRLRLHFQDGGAAGGLERREAQARDPGAGLRGLAGAARRQAAGGKTSVGRWRLRVFCLAHVLEDGGDHWIG